MSLPVREQRAYYAVYRGARNSDLVSVGNAAGADRPEGNDLIRALREVNDPSDGASVGGVAQATGCQTQGRAVAFFVVVPLVDRDGDGDRLDGPHPSSCARAPSLGASHSNDDVVIAESPFALIGWLQRP